MVLVEIYQYICIVTVFLGFVSVDLIMVFIGVYGICICVLLYISMFFGSESLYIIWVFLRSVSVHIYSVFKVFVSLSSCFFLHLLIQSFFFFF